MFVVIWEFVVRPERLDEFRRAYGPDGDWAGMFRRCEGYIETELLGDTEQPDRFITIDYWRHPEHHVAGIAQLGADYQALDERCAGYSISERRIGNLVKH